MPKEYRTIQEVAGPLMLVRVGSQRKRRARPVVRERDGNQPFQQ